MLHYLEAISLQIGFPTAENFSSYLGHDVALIHCGIMMQVACTGVEVPFIRAFNLFQREGEEVLVVSLEFLCVRQVREINRHLARNSLEVRRLLACLSLAWIKSSGKCGQPHCGQKYSEELRHQCTKSAHLAALPSHFLYGTKKHTGISFDTYIVNLGMKPRQIHQKICPFPYQPLYESDYCFLKNHAIFLLI